MPLIQDLVGAFSDLQRGDGTQPPRIPMILHSSQWRAEGQPPVVLKVNPHVVNFRQPKRITKKNTQGGTVFFHWSDINGQNNDILEMQFRGRTGNIRNKPKQSGPLSGITQSFLESSNVPGISSLARTVRERRDFPAAAAAAKHYTWTRLYTLTRQSVIDPVYKFRNVFSILYRSPLLPKQVIFYGFYNNVLEFGEVAEQPWLVEWSFSFIVQSTHPSLDELSSWLGRTLASNRARERTLNSQIQSSQAAETASTAAVSRNFKSG